MQIAVNTSFSQTFRSQVGEHGLLPMIAGVGFDAVELSLDALGLTANPWVEEHWQQTAQALKAQASSCGIRFHQAKAPTEFDWRRPDTNPLDGLIYPAMERALAICSEMQIPKLVVEPVTHPLVLNINTWKIRKNRDIFTRLLHMAEDYGVELAVTNLVRSFETPQELEALLELGTPEQLSFCLDVSRCQLSACSAAELIRSLGSRLSAVYLSGNHSRYDQHTIPGQGELRWDETLEALAEAGYRDTLTLQLSQEATGALDGAHGFHLDFAPEVLAFACASGKYLAGKLEALLRSRGGETV